MHSIGLFTEDFGHESFVRALLQRISVEYAIEVSIAVISVRGGHGTVLSELKQYLRDMRRGKTALPDLLVIGRDANCLGYNAASEQIRNALVDGKLTLPAILAVPDPHIERWMLIDSAAFKIVFGRGCGTPKHKCEKDHYKKLLREAILAAGINPALGGMEYAEDIVQHLDLTKRNESSLGNLIDTLNVQFNAWASAED